MIRLLLVLHYSLFTAFQFLNHQITQSLNHSITYSSRHDRDGIHIDIGPAGTHMHEADRVRAGGKT